MILITGLQYSRIEGDRAYIEEFRNRTVGEVDKIESHQPDDLMDLTKVLCEGKEFTSPSGEEIVVGLTPDVSKLLGAPLEALESAEKISKISYRDMVAARKQRDCLMSFRESMENLSFWGRLKFLFSGKLIKLEV